MLAFQNEAILKSMQPRFPIMWLRISSRAPRRLMWLSLLLWARVELAHRSCLLNLHFLTFALWVDNNNNGMIHFNWQCSTWNKMMFCFCSWFSILWLPLIEKVYKCSINFKFESSLPLKRQWKARQMPSGIMAILFKGWENCFSRIL